MSHLLSVCSQRAAPVQVPGGYKDSLSSNTELGRAVRDACNELDHLSDLEQDQLSKANDLLKQLGELCLGGLALCLHSASASCQLAALPTSIKQLILLVACIRPKGAFFSVFVGSVIKSLLAPVCCLSTGCMSSTSCQLGECAPQSQLMFAVKGY